MIIPSMMLAYHMAELMNSAVAADPSIIFGFYITSIPDGCIMRSTTGQSSRQ